MKRTLIRTLCTLLVLLLITSAMQAQGLTPPPGKGVFIPADLQDNDFCNPDSKWSYARCAWTDDVILFWEKPFGYDLAKAPSLEGHDMTVDLPNLMARVQQFYDFYKNDLRFILPGSNADRYRMMVMLNYSLEGTAYGGDYDGVIGALWIAPNRVKDQKMNCIAHELGHSFQSMISCDKTGQGMMGGGFYEMTSQWMLFNVNPEWPTDENYHWTAFIDQANLRFLAGENIYHSCYVLEYWSQKHGLPFIADLWRAAKRTEDPAMAYMRMQGLSTEAFAKELCDCYSRLLTFDFDGKHEMNKQYAGEFVNDKDLYTYGANSIKLDVKGKRKVTVDFKGEADASLYGYAYRLVAVSADAHATYSPIFTVHKGKVSLDIPSDVKGVYLVVTGFPHTYKPESFGFHQDENEEEPAVYKYTYLVK